MIETATISISIIIIAYFTAHLALGHLSIKWPSTNGILVSIKKKEWDVYSKSPSIQGVEKACHIKIKYEYSHKNKTYKGSRIKFGKYVRYSTPEEIEADEFIQNIKSSNFPVYYCSSFPRLSTLKRGIQNKNDHIFAIIFTLLIASVILCLVHAF